MRSTIRILCAAGLLAACTAISAHAQRGSEEPPPEPPVEGDPGGAGVWNTAAGKALSTFCAITPATRPSRVAPGESADFFLVLSLMDTHVIPGSGKVELAYERRQGPVVLGEWRIDPPAPGRLARAFRDKPVYENTAKIRLPLTIEPGTRHGKYPIRLKVTAEIANGQSGSLVGKFFEEVTHEVQVGPPMPRPRGIAPRAHGGRSQAGARVAEPEPASVPTSTPSTDRADAPSTESDGPAGTLRAPQNPGNTANGAGSAERGGAPTASDESSVDLLLLVVAAAAVLSVGVLVALRAMRR